MLSLVYTTLLSIHGPPYAGWIKHGTPAERHSPVLRARLSARTPDLFIQCNKLGQIPETEYLFSPKGSSDPRTPLKGAGVGSPVNTWAQQTLSAPSRDPRAEFPAALNIKTSQDHSLFDGENIQLFQQYLYRFATVFEDEKVVAYRYGRRQDAFTAEGAWIESRRRYCTVNLFVQIPNLFEGWFNSLTWLTHNILDVPASHEASRERDAADSAVPAASPTTRPYSSDARSKGQQQEMALMVTPSCSR